MPSLEAELEGVPAVCALGVLTTNGLPPALDHPPWSLFSSARLRGRQFSCFLCVLYLELLCCSVYSVLCCFRGLSVCKGVIDLTPGLGLVSKTSFVRAFL